MFSAGDSYDLFMGRRTARLAPLLVQFARVTDGDEVLDVGCGTGSLAAAAAAAAPSSHVVGDAQQLPFADASFDRAMSLLILNFVPDPRNALTEMIRVTRSGGIVASAVWDYGE